MIADSAYHVLCLPKSTAKNATASVQCVKPRKSDNILGRWRWERLCWVRSPKDQFKCWAKRSEFSLGNKCEVDLQGAGEEEHTIDPGFGPNIVVVERFVPVIHKPREIG
jgi:hypothetical protein